MKTKTISLMLVFASMLITIGSCSNDREKSFNNGVAMDSASVAQRAKDELTLSTLRSKKIAAAQKAKAAISNTKDAKRIERDATDAADQADQAYSTEEKAQKSRQQADAQAKKADKASDKADEN